MTYGELGDVGDVNYFAGYSLGKIQSWKKRKASTLTVVALPGADANLARTYDTLGVVSYFDITGRWTAQSFTVASGFEYIMGLIYGLESIADGWQFNPNPLRSPFVVGTFGPNSATVRVQGNISSNTSTVASQLHDATANFTTWNLTTDDIVKNLITGKIAKIATVSSGTVLTLSHDIFPVSGGTGVPYAVTATINAALVTIETNWELPGLSYCDYKMTFVQAE